MATNLTLVWDSPPNAYTRSVLARQLTRFGWRWEDFTHLGADAPQLGQGTFVALGTRAFERLTGLQVRPVLARGYVYPEQSGAGWVIAALPPAYYMQDPSGLLPTFYSDLVKAARVAQGGFAYLEVEARWQPPLSWWDPWVREFLADPTRRLAVDIETPWKKKAEMSEAEKAAPDMTFSIRELNLAYEPLRGVSIPWDGPYRDGALAMIRASQAAGTTLFWNKSYDCPRLEANSDLRFRVAHTRDAMDTFRVWRNSVPRKLAVAASMFPSMWNAKPWKHRGTGDPYYRAMDVVALLNGDADMFEALRAEGQWDAYCLAVRDLDPLLEHMTDVGLGVDAAKVLSLTAELERRLTKEQRAMTALVPEAILPTTVWKGRKAAENGLERLREAGEVLPDAALFEVPATVEVNQCSVCGETGVLAPHRNKKYRLDTDPQGAVDLAA